MEIGGQLPDSEAFEDPSGEVLGADIRRPAARGLNRALKKLRGTSPNTVMDFGGEHGEIFTDDVFGARDDDEPGKLKVYLRIAGEHKLEVAVIAAGVVIGGLAALKYKKR